MQKVQNRKPLPGLRRGNNGPVPQQAANRRAGDADIRHADRVTRRYNFNFLALHGMMATKQQKEDSKNCNNEKRRSYPSHHQRLRRKRSKRYCRLSPARPKRQIQMLLIES